LGLGQLQSLPNGRYLEAKREVQNNSKSCTDGFDEAGAVIGCDAVVTSLRLIAVICRVPT